VLGLSIPVKGKFPGLPLLPGFLLFPENISIKKNKQRIRDQETWFSVLAVTLSCFSLSSLVAKMRTKLSLGFLNFKTGLISVCPSKTHLVSNGYFRYQNLNVFLTSQHLCSPSSHPQSTLQNLGCKEKLLAREKTRNSLKKMLACLVLC
jgi:hypothetical protein